MKRSISLVSLFAFSSVLLIPGINPKGADFLSAAQAQSQSPGKCSNATFKGTYAINFQGFVKQGDTNVPYVAVGIYTSGGEGSLQGKATIVVNGGPPLQQNGTATYNINPDCTGSSISPEFGTFSFVASPDGNTIKSISTTVGSTTYNLSERLYK